MSELVEVIEDAGEGPALVYVPGVDGTGQLLLDTAASLKQCFRLVRLRYVSGSRLPSIDRGYGEMATDIVRVLDELGIDRALLLAESFGVALALRTALDHPSRVRALGLLNGFIRYPSRWRIRLATALLPAVPRVLLPLGRRITIPYGMLAPRRNSQVAQAMIERVGDYFDASFRRRLEMVAAVDLRGRLHDVSCPVSVFASTHDRVVPSLRTAQQMVSELPDVRLEVIERAGHVILPFTDEPWTDRMQALEARA